MSTSRMSNLHLFEVFLSRLSFNCFVFFFTDSSDIVDCKLKLILGLIWTLILHYSISMPMWDGDEEQSEKPQQTPKQRLLSWVQNKLTDLPVNNFTTAWNDGKAMGALVDSVAPGRLNNHNSLITF